MGCTSTATDSVPKYALLLLTLGSLPVLAQLFAGNEWKILASVVPVVQLSPATLQVYFAPLQAASSLPHLSSALANSELTFVFITEEGKKYPLLKKCFQADSQRIKKITTLCWNTGCSERWLQGPAAPCVKQGPGGRFHSVKSTLTLCLGMHVKPNS